MSAPQRETQPHHEPLAGAAPQQGMGLAGMRAANRACILATLEREGPLSRAALAQRVGLSRTTVGAIISELLCEARVREVGALPAAEVGGRRATLLVIC